MHRRDVLAQLLLGPVMAAGHSSVSAGAQTGDLTSFTIEEALRRIAAREISAVDLTEAYLSRIQTLNPDLNAFVTVTRARARADARRVERTPGVRDAFGHPVSHLLRGMPIAHKDLFETAGIRTTAGSKLFEKHVPSKDAAVVARLGRAGAVLLGKTNTHELGGGVTTINPFYGPTRNPADTTRIPGGSSGGSAAAVAARLVAGATGSDTGGSVRIPAALCGCVGFKPTFDAIPAAGLLGACPTFDHVGLLARTVPDVALMFQAATGRRVAPQPARPLRVGVARQFFFDNLSTDVAAAMARAIERIRTSGASVEDRDLPIDTGTMARVFDPIVVSEIWSRYGKDWRERPRLFSPEFAEFFKQPAPPGSVVAEARRALRDFQASVARVFDSVDVILTPTVPVTAPPIEGPIDGALILRNTWPFNAARTPTISIPCGSDTPGLPIGLQLAARAGNDELLLMAAAELERLL